VPQQQDDNIVLQPLNSNSYIREIIIDDPLVDPPPPGLLFQDFLNKERINPITKRVPQKNTIEINDEINDVLRAAYRPILPPPVIVDQLIPSVDDVRIDENDSSVTTEVGTRPLLTDIIWVQDISGSMGNILTDAVGSFNTFIEEQKLLSGECYVTLIAFSAAYTVLYNRVQLKYVQPLTIGYSNNQVYASGSTSLLDAVFKALTALPDYFHVMVRIMTDGEENSSKETTKEAIKELVARKVAAGWDIGYVGVGINAFSEASTQLGLATSQIMQTKRTSEGLKSYATAYSLEAKGFRGH
jgi:hypothetical protein